MTTVFDYLASRDDADELITEFGRSVLLRRRSASGSAAEPTFTVNDYATFAVRVEFTWKQLQGGDVLRTDQRWLVAAGPLAALGVTETLPNDAVVIDGAEIPIVQPSPLQPAATVVMFDCQLRF